MADNQKHVQLYEKMLAYVRDFMEQAKNKSEPVEKSLDNAFEEAREQLSKLGELSREEIETVSDYLARDIHAAGEYIEESEEQLGPWLKFDIELVEDRILDAFNKIADPATVQQLQFFRNLKDLREYHTGEVTGLGTLKCTSCGELIHFHKPGHIPPCPKCHATMYERVSD